MAGALGLTTGAYSPGDVVPSTAMNRKVENVPLPFSGGSIGALPTAWQEVDAKKIPWACDVVQVTAWCKSLVTGGSVDIQENDVSILSAPIALSPATHVAGTISAADIAQDADLSMKVLALGELSRVKVLVTLAVD